METHINHLAPKNSPGTPASGNLPTVCLSKLDSAILSHQSTLGLYSHKAVDLWLSESRMRGRAFGSSLVKSNLSLGSGGRTPQAPSSLLHFYEAYSQRSLWWPWAILQWCCLWAQTPRGPPWCTERLLTLLAVFTHHAFIMPLHLLNFDFSPL